MNATGTRVLVVEDDRVARELLTEILSAEGCEVTSAADGVDAIASLQEQAFDIVVSDVRMEGAGGMEVLAAAQERDPDMPVILITAFGDVDGAMAAIEAGAYDYVSKPFKVDELKLTVARAIERRRLMVENDALRHALPARQQDESIVGASPGMLEVYKLVARVAATGATVLVVGESGTGKELVARAIHRHSPRAAGRFLAVNCSSLTDTLLESELFGHERGAFTGAVQARRGLFEEAHGGTFFLDEIGDVGSKMQAQLLRVLQQGEIRRVGSSTPIRVDVRIVAATNRDLGSEVAAGRFREDLFFRVNVVTLVLPPLRERRSDIPLLVEHFLLKYASREGQPRAAIAPDALAALCTYSWPGNVRELENAVERALALSKGGIILPADLPPEVGKAEPACPGVLDDRPTLAELERRYLRLVLAECGGNKTRAAEILGIDRRTVYRLLGDSGQDRGGADADGLRPEDDDGSAPTLDPSASADDGAASRTKQDKP